MEWAELDLDTAEWRIPGINTTMRIDHIVPLAKQAVQLLRRAILISGHGKFVLPSIRTDERCMIENTINAALCGIGYTKEMITGHGFGR